MGLTDFFTAAQNQLATILEAQHPPERIPEFLVGAENLNNEGAPPRIVWVLGREVWKGPHAQGGDGHVNPRPLRTRHAHVAAHVWGCAETDSAADDIATVERLVQHLVAAVNDVAFGAWDVSGGSWEIGQDSSTRKGTVFVVDFEVQVPATREPDTYAVVTTMPVTPQVVV